MVHAHMRDARFKVIETLPTDYIIVESNTLIDCEGDPINDEEEREDEEGEEEGEGDGHFRVWFDDIGGCSDQIAEIRSLIELPWRHPELWSAMGVKVPRGILLHGPMGTGKTLLARAIANETGAYFFVLNGSEIFAKDLGQSELILRQVFAEAETKTPAIIFIDEIDVIAEKRGKADGDLAKRLVPMLNLLMDSIKSQIVVIGATNRNLNSLDPSLQRFGRFSVQIALRVPSEVERMEILRIHTKKMPIDEDVDLEEIAKETRGFVGADLGYLCNQAAMLALREQMNLQDLGKGDIDDVIDRIEFQVLPSMRIKMRHFHQVLPECPPANPNRVTFDPPNVTWEDIAGLSAIKRDLREAIQFLSSPEQEDMRQKFGMEPSKGVLLYGPPACGKSHLAQALANDCQESFISVDMAELLNHRDVPECGVRDIFDHARAFAPCILFFDNLHLVCHRDAGIYGDRIVNQLLSEMDGIYSRHNIFCIAATTRPDIVDTVLIRPGRFDQLIYVPEPNAAARLEILRMCFRSFPIASDVDLDLVATNSSNQNCAELIERCGRVHSSQSLFTQATNYDIKTTRLALLEHMVANAQKREGEGVEDGYLFAEKEDELPLLERRHFEAGFRRGRRGCGATDDINRRYEMFAQMLVRSRPLGEFQWPPQVTVDPANDDDDLYS